MALMARDQYLSSMRVFDRSVFIQGEKVHNIVDHPISGPPAMAMAETFHQAEHEDKPSLFTVPSHLTGEIINRFTHI